MSRAALSFEIVEDFGRLVELRSEWSAFAQTLESLTPFQLPEWLLTWWRHFGSGQLRCFLFRRGDEWAGFVPCFLHEWNGARQITLIGTGISDYLEPAIKPEDATEIVELIRGSLESTSDWDICDWQDLCVDTPFRSLASRIGEDVQCMAIPIEGSFEAYWQSCASSLRQNVRRDRAKAEARGSIQFDVTKQAAPELLDALIQMHGARWRRQDQPGMIEANRSADFLRDMACEFAGRGLLRIFSIRFDEKPAAIVLGFAYRGRISNYLTAFEPEYERLGFGRALLYEALRYSFQNGCRSWDFLRGDERYKHWWRARAIPKVRLRVTRKA